MLFQGIPFADIWRRVNPNSLASEAVVRFVHFLENRLGGRFLYDYQKVPFGHVDLADLFEIGASLRAANVIRDINPIFPPSDEPPFKQWRVECATPDNHAAGGMSIDSERDALIPALAEAIERYIWLMETDYFQHPQTATVSEISKRGRAMLPESFVGFSDEQRSRNKLFSIESDSKFLWVQGVSHIDDKLTWLPAQVASGRHGAHATKHGHEPMILTPITTGLATGPTKEFALLNGALEIIERDAFMITWLNQLTPPKVDLEAISKNDKAFQKILQNCARYKLSVSAVALPTDAPAHAVCAIVRDDSGFGPNVTVGLKAHRSLADAVRGACMEALRIRQTVRFRDIKTPLDPNKAGKDIVHLERAQYWGRSGSADKLAFLTKGPLLNFESRPWDDDNIEQHWQRILDWCRKSGYQCASVNVGRSRHNVSPWKIRMVVMPELQPMHQTERHIYLGGKRLAEVPKMFGFDPRSKPYDEEPHPFA